ncbi:MAG: carboxypeptidase-like regulatory domain-containing protein, partial [Bacteroidaceae bacterium]|nr:carboxypeptidase-like regulatory domain-containing protein [Bacteroidaceae bacterium]
MKTNSLIINIVCIIMCCICPLQVMAQTATGAKGVIMDEFGEALPAASVAVMSNSKMVRGTSTNLFGEFNVEINLEGGDQELVFSYLGTKTVRMKITKELISKPIEVVLKTDDAMLAEVTIVEDGYNRLPRKDMVGAFTTVKADDIMMPAYQSIDQMLQGKVAGMSVVNTSARVGASPKITIRGTSTILGNSDPLWVVDGVIQEDPLSIDMSSAITSDMRELIGNQISWLNPQ